MQVVAEEDDEAEEVYSVQRNNEVRRNVIPVQ